MVLVSELPGKISCLPAFPARFTREVQASQVARLITKNDRLKWHSVNNVLFHWTDPPPIWIPIQCKPKPKQILVYSAHALTVMSAAQPCVPARSPSWGRSWRSQGSPWAPIRQQTSYLSTPHSWSAFWGRTAPTARRPAPCPACSGQMSSPPREKRPQFPPPGREAYEHYFNGGGFAFKHVKTSCMWFTQKTPGVMMRMQERVTEWHKFGDFSCKVLYAWTRFPFIEICKTKWHSYLFTKWLLLWTG